MSEINEKYKSQSRATTRSERIERIWVVQWTGASRLTVSRTAANISSRYIYQWRSECGKESSEYTNKKELNSRDTSMGWCRRKSASAMYRGSLAEICSRRGKEHGMAQLCWWRRIANGRAASTLRTSIMPEKNTLYSVHWLYEILYASGGSKLFIILDLTAGYWNVEPDEGVKERSPFILRSWSGQLNFLPFRNWYLSPLNLSIWWKISSTNCMGKHY